MIRNKSIPACLETKSELNVITINTLRTNFYFDVFIEKEDFVTQIHRQNLHHECILAFLVPHMLPNYSAICPMSDSQTLIELNGEQWLLQL